MEKNLQNEYEKSFIYIENDNNFSNKIKNYYPDLTNCEKINYSYSGNVKPITIQDFNIGMLTKTTLLNRIINIEKYNQNEQTNIFKSIYDFPEYYIEQNEILESSTECKIILTFSKKINNILPIKFQIFDKNIDSRINYKPRIGLYIIEFNNEKEIIDSEYLIMSN